jgi:hypothetical protein
MKQRFGELAGFLSCKGLKTIEILLLLALLAWIYCRDLYAVEFHPDETYWIASSIRLDTFLAREFDDPIWSEDELVNYEARPIPSYFAAMGQRLGGIHVTGLPVYWDWEVSTEENIARGALPTDEMLWWSRLPMAIISVLSMVGVALLLARAHSRMAAYMFTLFSFNDYFLAQFQRAWSEASLLLFTVLSLYASYRLFIAAQGSSLRGVFLWSAAVGVFSGLAGQSKLTGLACAAVAILGTMALMADPANAGHLSKKRVPLIITFVVLGIMLVAFIASYPFFYRNTLDRIATTFAARGQIVQYQIQRYPELTVPAGSRSTVLFQRIFNYPIHLDTGSTTLPLFHWVNFLLTAFGIYSGVKQVRQKEKDWEYFLVFLLGAFILAVPMLLTPLDWERYYLYPIFFSCIFASLAIGELLLIGTSSTQKQEDEKRTQLERMKA